MGRLGDDCSVLLYSCAKLIATQLQNDKAVTETATFLGHGVQLQLEQNHSSQPI